MSFSAGEPEHLGWFARADPGHPSGADGVARTWRAREFELSSRGDRVTGSLLEPPLDSGDGPFPLVLVADTESESGADVPTLLEDLLERGCAVVRVDLPLHGARAEHKLAACVEQGWSGAGPMASLAREWAVQTCTDLGRCLDAFAAEARLDSTRVAFLGVGFAAEVGALFCAEDARVVAAAFAPTRPRVAAPDLDPEAARARFEPRPLLVLDATDARAAAVPFLCEALGL